MQKPQQGTYHPIVAVLLLVCLLDVASEKLTDLVLDAIIRLTDVGRR